TTEVLQQQIDHVVLVSACLAGSVRRDQYVGNVPQRRCVRQRLLDGAVEAGTRDPALRQRIEQGRFIDHLAARYVDQKRRRFHPGQRLRVNQAFSLRRQRTGERDEIGKRQHFAQASLREHVVRILAAAAGI